ncbi:MAG TPA: polyketide synthase dehydratase domain-containing protein, partial [Thermoanaerobaculia bacterium]
PADPPAAATSGADGRHRVVGRYLETMDGFLAVQRELTSAFLRRRGAGSARVVPWVLRGARRAGGEDRLAFRRRLDPREEVFLRDHTLGGRVSADAAVGALPVVPLAMSLELLAEAAALRRPGLRPVRLEGVKVRRWLTCDSPTEVEVSATASGPDTVALRLARLADAGDEAGRAIVEATARMAPSPAAAAPAARPPLRNPRPCRWAGEDLYREGLRHGMFHGPTLRGVASVDAIGDDGAAGTLVAVPEEATLAFAAAPFLILPLVLDAVSQLLGYWTAQVLDRDFVVFPSGIDRVELFARRVPVGSRLGGRVEVREVGERYVRADLEVAGADGSPVLRAAGWRVERSRLPDAVYRFRLDPRGTALGDPLRPPEAEGLAAVRLELPGDFLFEQEGIWTAALAALALSAGERALFDALPEDARPGRLLELLAGKEAVRRLLASGGAAPLFPADVVLEAREEGWSAATVQGPEPPPEAPPAVAVARCAAAAVAVAGPRRDASRLPDLARRLVASAPSAGAGPPLAPTAAQHADSEFVSSAH